MKNKSSFVKTFDSCFQCYDPLKCILDSHWIEYRKVYKGLEAECCNPEEDELGAILESPRDVHQGQECCSLNHWPTFSTQRSNQRPSGEDSDNYLQQLSNHVCRSILSGTDASVDMHHTLENLREALS